MKKNVNINPPLQMSQVLKKMCESLKKPAPEGVSEEKYDSCVEQVKAKQGKKVNAYAVCGAALKRSDIESFNKLVKNWGSGQIKKIPSLKNTAQPKPKGTAANPTSRMDTGYGKVIVKAAPAPAPAPKPAAPAMPKMQTPKMKAPKIKAPTQKMPEMQMSAMKKDDKPHPPGSPGERSHAVVEHGASFPKAMADMNRKGHDATHRFLNHLRSLKNRPDRMRSPENVLKTEGDSGKKYVTVSQHWASGIHNRASGKYENPVRDAGKKQPEHMDDLHKLKEKGHIHGWSEHKEPVKRWGEETYEVHPDGKLKFVHADYDTSD